MPNSGAFRSLHCLIYKVLAPSAQRRNIWYFSRSVRVCQVLFSTFFEVFSALSSAPVFLPNSLTILSNHFRFVKHYFQLFKTFYRPLSLKLDRSRQLWYCTIGTSFCQYLFSAFSKLFYRRRLCSTTARDSLVNIPDNSSFVNTFLQKNRAYF